MDDAATAVVKVKVILVCLQTVQEFWLRGVETAVGLGAAKGETQRGHYPEVTTFVLSFKRSPFDILL